MKTESKMAVFIDHAKAQFITFENGIAKFDESIESGKETHPRERGQGSNQTRFGTDPYQGSNNEYSKNMQSCELMKVYFHQIKNKLTPYQDILLFGAGQAKKELHNYLVEQSAFRDKNINLQNSDYLTENQLLENVRNYFSE
jgi:hypothetical protein